MCSEHPFPAMCFPSNVYCDLDVPCIDQRSVDVICNACLIHIDRSFGYNNIINSKA